MPVTKDKYLVRENPHLVAWEREVRKFLRRLSPDHGHRVAAVMVYEWATGIQVKDLMNSDVPLAPGKQNWRSDLRKLNKILKWYFGKPYMTWIMGRKVPNTFRVKPGYYITRHRPMTLTLYAEYVEGTLDRDPSSDPNSGRRYAAIFQRHQVPAEGSGGEGQEAPQARRRGRPPLAGNLAPAPGAAAPGGPPVAGDPP